MSETFEGIAGWAIDGMKSAILAGMEDRGKNATGTTARSITTSVFGGANYASASLSANRNWRWVGNGRGPGKMPPVDNIAQWVEARGLNLSPWAVALKIARSGTLDYRRGNENVFLENIDGWINIHGTELDDKLAASELDAVYQILKTKLEERWSFGV